MVSPVEVEKSRISLSSACFKGNLFSSSRMALTDNRTSRNADRAIVDFSGDADPFSVDSHFFGILRAGSELLMGVFQIRIQPGDSNTGLLIVSDQRTNESREHDESGAHNIHGNLNTANHLILKEDLR
jgi:hypothetical protein